jgi:Flp pilus assembly protein TadG
MRLRTNVFARSFNALSDAGRRFLGDRRGNFGMTFALIAVPMLLGIGVSIDYVRAYNVKVKMQSDLDAALIASVKEVDSLNENQIKAKVALWFDAQKDINVATYSLAATDITVSKANRTIRAVATGVVPTTFLGLANITSVPVSVTTSVSGPATSYLNVYLVLDKSASMMLPATTAGQDMMKKYASGACVFACHVSEGSSKYKGTTYSTNYALSKAMGVSLRTDVALTAAQEVLDLVSASDPTQSRIKVGLYTIGTDAHERYAPNASMSAVKTALLKDSNYMTSSTSETTTDFKTSMATLKTLVGTAGDGSTANAPLKLVLMLTDGVHSQRPWVTNMNYNTWQCVSWVNNSCVKYNGYFFPDQPKTTPLNPNWCSAIKTTNVTMGVLYTEYLSIPLDWGYNGTVGETMKTSVFTTTWGGTLRKGTSNTTVRRDYIPYALEDCASSAEMFLSAADPDAIEQGLSTLFQQYLGSVRLTQ